MRTAIGIAIALVVTLFAANLMLFTVSEVEQVVVTQFGKPKRVSVCECERSPDENLGQALHTLNGDTIAKKIADKNGRLAKLIEAKKEQTEIVDEIFLASLCRYPSEAEKKACQEIVEQAASPLEGYQDVMWAVLNLKRFIFVH